MPNEGAAEARSAAEIKSTEDYYGLVVPSPTLDVYVRVWLTVPGVIFCKVDGSCVPGQVMMYDCVAPLPVVTNVYGELGETAAGSTGVLFK